jgi:hypothetical protein
MNAKGKSDHPGRGFKERSISLTNKKDVTSNAMNEQQFFTKPPKP